MPFIRRLLIGGGMSAVLALLWLTIAHGLSLIIDKIFLVPVASAASTPVGWNGVYLQFGSPLAGAAAPNGGLNGAALGAGSHILDLEGPGPAYPEVAKATVDADNRLVLSMNGRSLVLGPRSGDLPTGETPIPAYAAEPGDVSALTIERSLLSWPVFELNFMTGQSPRWRRDIYYHLSWTKRSGERLDLLWRFEQGFYADNGWESPDGTADGLTGLIHAEIQPAPAAPARR